MNENQITLLKTNLSNALMEAKQNEESAKKVLAAARSDRTKLERMLKLIDGTPLRKNKKGNEKV